MIRLFIVVGIVGTVLVSYLATYGQGPEFQLPPAVSLLTKFEAEGVVPAADELVENEEAEAGIFERPAEDDEQLRNAMSMNGMNMDSGGTTNMPMGEGAPANNNMNSEEPASMPMGDSAQTGMNTNTEQPANMPMGGDAQTGMGMDSEGGLRLTDDGSFEREINLAMAEWKFSSMNIEVKRGERIRFNVTNDGKIPHEFMFMTMPAMAAITYRARRADWSLLEHEALFEKSLVLPGGTFSFVAEIEEDGAWMFMCMLPYHMEMGMMGQMATPGNAMSMGM